MTPLYGMPSFPSPLMVGMMTWFSAFCWNSSDKKGTGEMAPMPPVLGPVSPSPMRL